MVSLNHTTLLIHPPLMKPAHLANNPVAVPHFLQFSCLRIPRHTLPWGCVEGRNGPELTHLLRDTPHLYSHPPDLGNRLTELTKTLQCLDCKVR